MCVSTILPRSTYHDSNTRQLSEAEIDPTDHATNLFSREAAAVIKQHAAASPSKPLFLYVHHLESRGGVWMVMMMMKMMMIHPLPLPANQPHLPTPNPPSYLGYSAPHDPLQADPEFLAKCAGIPNRHRRAFCGMMAQLDAGVGNVTQVGGAVGSGWMG